MKFYRENKVNPFASCLPLAAQLPVFLALFYMLRHDLRLDICPEVNPPGTTNPVPCGAGGDAQFLFIPDLTDKATGGVLVTLIVLYVGSQLLSTILMSTATDKTQRMIFLALPFVFVVFVINFPAGLLVYWITTNFWTIVQQTIVRKRLGPMRPPSADGDPVPMSIMDRMIHRNRGPDAGVAAARGRGDGEATTRQGRREPKAPAAVAASGNRGESEAARRPDRHLRRRASARNGPAVADERVPRTRPADRVRALLEQISDALAWTRTSRLPEDGDHIRAVLRGRGHGPVHRTARPDDRCRPASRLQDRCPRRIAGAEGRGRCRRLPRAAATGIGADRRPGRGRRARARAGPSRSMP